MLVKKYFNKKKKGAPNMHPLKRGSTMVLIVLPTAPDNVTGWYNNKVKTKNIDPFV